MNVQSFMPQTQSFCIPDDNQISWRMPRLQQRNHGRPHAPAWQSSPMSRSPPISFLISVNGRSVFGVFSSWTIQTTSSAIIRRTCHALSVRRITAPNRPGPSCPDDHGTCILAPDNLTEKPCSTPTPLDHIPGSRWHEVAPRPGRRSLQP